MAPICEGQHLRRTPAICDNDGIIYLADLKTWHFVDEELDPVLRTVMRSLEDHTLPCLWGLVCPVAPIGSWQRRFAASLATMLELAFWSPPIVDQLCRVTLQNNSCCARGQNPRTRSLTTSRHGVDLAFLPLTLNAKPFEFMVTCSEARGSD